MSNKQKTKNSFIVQGVILAAAGIFSRMIGLIYRVPLIRILGDNGNGIYTSAYYIYNLLLMVSSLSLPLAISKIVSAKVASRNYKECKRILKCSLWFAMCVGGFISVITFVFSDPIAKGYGCPSASPALKVLAPTVFVMSIVGVLRGYFQGLNTMVPTATSQVFEQIMNAVFSIVAAYLLAGVGANIANRFGKGTMRDAYAAAGGTVGTLMGALTALVIMMIYYFVNRRVITFEDRIVRDPYTEYESTGEILKLLIVTIIPVLLSTTVYQLSNLLDNLIYHNVLNGKGIEEEMRNSIWGVYGGSYVLITNIPVALAAALSSSLVPSLIDSYTRGNKRELADKISVIFKFIFIFSLPCGIGLMALGRPIMAMLFPRTDLPLAYSLMMFSFFTVIAYSLSTITNSILQGVDKLKLPLVHSAISFVIHVILLTVSLISMVKGSNPKKAIYIVLVFDILYSVILCILNFAAIRRHTRYRMEVIGTVIKPFFSSLIMGLVTYGAYIGMKHVIPYRISCCISIAIAVCVYAVTLMVFKTVTEEELLNMPMGLRIYRLLKKVHLMN